MSESLDRRLSSSLFFFSSLSFAASIGRYSIVPQGVELKDRKTCDPKQLTVAVASAKASKILQEVKEDALLICCTCILLACFNVMCQAN